MKSEVSESRMIETVRKLSKDFHPRSYKDHENLELTAQFIEQHFRETKGQIEIQTFEASGSRYRNISCIFGDPDLPRVIIGAHYDSHKDTPGADDNASGIAGLIELAYLFNQTEAFPYCIELVAYPLEEPPHFGSFNMGSFHHAQKTQSQQQTIRGVIILEMIGYFNDSFGSQDYPSTLFKLLYPNRGNFIAVIGKLDQREYTLNIKKGMKASMDLEIRSVNAPEQIQGIDFSDHRNYWAHGLNAVMITDTAFYRNKAYHEPNDTWDRLDYSRMCEVIKGVYSAALQIPE